ncbi:MAG: hypothetical protein JWM80_5853 [Cyanobacteria bacterium RYN_339]|nr:hypothetical protein [Cyanobacteria bacterium RYN_339]
MSNQDSLTEERLPMPTLTLPRPVATEEAAIQQAMLDYAEGWYTGDMARMRRALHPALAKRATLPADDGTMALSEYPAEALIARVGKNTPEAFADAPKASRVTIFAVHGNTATGLLEMDGWTDFMHVIKVDGAWQVINILWEPNA